MLDFAHELSHWSEKSCRSFLEAKDILFIQSVLGSKLDSGQFNPKFMEVLLSEDKLFFTILESVEPLPISAQLYFYVLLQKAFSEANIYNPLLLDYIVFVLVSNMHTNYINKGESIFYISDYLTKINLANDNSKFYLRIELSNQILFFTGLFQDFIHYRTSRTGAPTIDFYEEIGSSQYGAVIRHPLANELHLKNVFIQLSDGFSQIRQTLNQFSERFISLGEPFIKNWFI